MAQVSISVGDISVGVEDEDASAKSLRKVALSVVHELVGTFGTRPADDEEDADG
jgi:hypothetical protein